MVGGGQKGVGGAGITRDGLVRMRPRHPPPSHSGRGRPFNVGPVRVVTGAVRGPIANQKGHGPSRATLVSGPVKIQLPSRYRV